MKGAVASFAAGVGIAVAGAWMWDSRRQAGKVRQLEPERRVADQPGHFQPEETVDLNAAAPEDLRRLGLDDAQVDRLVEHRPYRNKLDLVSQLVLPRDAYDRIRHFVFVNGDHEPVKIA